MATKKNQKKFLFTLGEECKAMMAIYKICFGPYFFVGGAKRLVKRAYQHSEEIERKLRLGNLKEGDIYTKIIDHILKTGAKEFTVHVIFPVTVESELPMYEQRIYDLVKDNPFCLNTNFEAKERTYQETKKEKAAAVLPASGSSSEKQQPAPAETLPAVTDLSNNPYKNALAAINAKYGTAKNA